MAFRPVVDSHIHINRRMYTFTEHPAAPGMPYGQSGKRATVYQVMDARSNLYALKIFTRVFRTEHIEKSTEALKSLSHLPGLDVCNRQVITAERFPSLVQKNPDLQYAVLMPWVKGQTWQEIVLSKQILSPRLSQSLALDFLTVAATMEQNGVAHCDLSGPNVIISDLHSQEIAGVQLVDVEEMHGPGLIKPDRLPGGSAGYAHKTSSQGIWSLQADRFAASILLAEMLCWFDAAVRDNAYGEQYFAPDDLQQPVERFTILRNSLQTYENSHLISLLDNTWESDRLEDCPTISAWQQALAFEKSSNRSKRPALTTFKPSLIPLGSQNMHIPGPVAKKRDTRKGRKTSKKSLSQPRLTKTPALPHSNANGPGPLLIISSIGLILFFVFSLFTSDPAFIMIATGMLFFGALSYRIWLM